MHKMMELSFSGSSLTIPHSKVQGQRTLLRSCRFISVSSNSRKRQVVRSCAPNLDHPRFHPQSRSERPHVFIITHSFIVDRISSPALPTPALSVLSSAQVWSVSNGRTCHDCHLPDSSKRINRAQLCKRAFAADGGTRRARERPSRHIVSCSQGFLTLCSCSTNLSTNCYPCYQFQRDFSQASLHQDRLHA